MEVDTSPGWELLSDYQDSQVDAKTPSQIQHDSFQVWRRNSSTRVGINFSDRHQKLNGYWRTKKSLVLPIYEEGSGFSSE